MLKCLLAKSNINKTTIHSFDMLIRDFLAIPVPIFDACIGFILIGMDLEIFVGGFIIDDVRAFVVLSVSKF